MASRAPGWIHMKFHEYSIKNQLENGLKSSRPDLYEIWSFTNQESIKEWPQELQARFIWNLIIFQLRLDEEMASSAPDWIHIKFDDFSIKNKIRNGLKSSRLDSY